MGRASQPMNANQKEAQVLDLVRQGIIHIRVNEIMSFKQSAIFLNLADIQFNIFEKNTQKI